MKRYVIDSVHDIRTFFIDLHVRTRYAFLPEDDLTGILSKSGTPVFSKAEAAYFDDIAHFYPTAVAYATFPLSARGIVGSLLMHDLNSMFWGLMAVSQCMRSNTCANVITSFWQ